MSYLCIVKDKDRKRRVLRETIANININFARINSSNMAPLRDKAEAHLETKRKYRTKTTKQCSMFNVQCEILKLNFNYGLLRLSPRGGVGGGQLKTLTMAIKVMHSDE